MTKTRKAGRRRGAEEQRAKVEPTGHCTPSAAGARVFAIEELTREILRHVPKAVLLSRLQRTCRLWSAVARELLQPLLDGAPRSPNSQRFDRNINPILLEHFGKILDNGGSRLEIGLWLTGRHYSYMRSLIDLPIATSGPGRAMHNAYARVGASWRTMQTHYPPVYELRYRREPDAQVQVVTVADGVRLGHVYDVLFALTSKTTRTTWNKVWLTWPQASAAHGFERGEGDADGGHGKTALGDYILLERRQQNFPQECICAWRTCLSDVCVYEYRKEVLSRLSSNKWRVSSDAFSKENLLVEI